MKSIVITLVGNDKPGLIDSIAKAIAAAKGNWQASSFAHMAGHFAGFAEIQIPEENEAALLEKLQNHPDLKKKLSVIYLELVYSQKQLSVWIHLHPS